MGHYRSWELEEGEEIVPGRTALKPIGGGNRYEVYLVWDEHLYSLGVAKLLRPGQTEDERALRDLEKEVEALCTLSHPVLIRHFDARLEGPRPHILIEHLEGPSLRRLIKRGGALPLEQVLPLAIHVAGALQYMANVGYVHLDCKPDNIVMGVPPRLIDLSIARTVGRAAKSSGPLGTAAYQAPEQCGDESATHPIGSPADAWGLAATLFHAVSGRRPFHIGGRESSGPDRYRQLVDEPRPLPEHLPLALRELILDMLSRDPAARPTCAAAIERLEPIIADLPTRMTFTPRGVLGG